MCGVVRAGGQTQVPFSGRKELGGATVVVSSSQFSGKKKMRG